MKANHHQKLPNYARSQAHIFPKTIDNRNSHKGATIMSIERTLVEKAITIDDDVVVH
jgi:hypothetical protein